MQSATGMLAYLALGTIGGLIGARTKIPVGPLIFAMLTVIGFKLLVRIEWQIPPTFTFVLQILLGVMVGVTFEPSLIQALRQVFLPVLISTVTLVGTGVLLAIVFTRLGLLDMSTAFLGTSPGAMSALVVIALEKSPATAPLIVAFHFFRVIFVIITAPLIFKFLLQQ